MNILIGTTNPAKIKLFEQLLAGYPITFVTLKELGVTAEPEEMGSDPAQNAAVKAAFYGKYADYVICNDSGLYFDCLPLDDPRQPGLHIRTPGGKRLDDEAMIAYYAQLVHSLGGRVLAYYLDGFAVKTPAGVRTYLKSREEARKGAFWILDTPAAARRPGWPLDSLSTRLDGVPFIREGLKLKPTSGQDTQKVWADFLIQSLGLEPLEEA